MKGIIKFLGLLLVATIAYGGIVINEINFYPETWVELYNSSPYDVSLNGYYLITPDGEYPLDNVIIKANSYVILSKERLFSDKDFQINIELSNSGGFIVILKNNSIIDFVNWGMLAEEWRNSYPYLWDNAPLANINLSREPDGTDTDSPSDFKSTETPTPLSPNAPMGLDPISWSRIKALFRDAHKRM